MTRVNQPSIFRYDDYRKFARDCYLTAKAAHGTVSLATLARKVGVTRMSVKHVLDGKRHIAESRIKAFARALNLDPAASDYFRKLVLLNKAKNDEERVRLLENITSTTMSPYGELYLDEPSIGFYRHWIYPVIAELSYVRGFRPEAEWIQRHLAFPVERRTVEAALADLDRMGFLKGGRRAQAKIKVPAGFRSIIYKRFVTDMAKQACTAVGKQAAEDRQFSTLTVSVDETRFKQAKALVEEFRHRLHDLLANDAECDRVIHVNVQLFTAAHGPVIQEDHPDA